MPVEYDPLLAKLIAYGETRSEAITKLKRAVDEYVVGGVKTNLNLFRQILDDPAFLAGKTDTGYLTRLPQRTSSSNPALEQEIAAIAAAIFTATDHKQGNGAGEMQPTAPSAWKNAARSEALR